MAKQIKALDTYYDGHKFRSALEARWYIFFKELGLHIEYEPTGFKLKDSGCYLPDFKYKDYYIEIKPLSYNHEDWDTHKEFAKHHRLLIIVGDPYPGKYNIFGNDNKFLKLYFLQDEKCGCLCIVNDKIEMQLCEEKQEHFPGMTDRMINAHRTASYYRFDRR